MVSASAGAIFFRSMELHGRPPKGMRSAQNNHLFGFPFEAIRKQGATFMNLFSLGHLHFLHQNKVQNAKTGSTSQLFLGVGCASLLYFCEKLGLNFSTPKRRVFPYFFRLSSTATATETVAPTMGLLPMPRKPIISTWAGTEEEPANWASLCIRPMVSVMP